MKSKTILIGFCAVTAALSLIAVVIGRSHTPAKTAVSGAKAFEVRGQVRSVDAVNKIIRITHEAIPDYMPAMTMPFAVKDPNVLAGVQPGDRILARGKGAPGGTTIAAIRELEQAGVRAAFLNASQAAMDRSRELAEGDA